MIVIKYKERHICVMLVNPEQTVEDLHRDYKSCGHWNRPSLSGHCMDCHDKESGLSYT